MAMTPEERLLAKRANSKKTSTKYAERIRAYAKAYRAARKAHYDAYAKTYNAEHVNKERAAQRSREAYAAGTSFMALAKQELRDCYVRSALHMPCAAVDDRLLELKREQLKTARVLKQLKHTIGELNGTK